MPKDPHPSCRDVGFNASAVRWAFAYENKQLPVGHLLLDSSWSHRGKRRQLWSLSDCAEDTSHTHRHLPPAYRNPPRMLQREKKQLGENLQEKNALE